MRVLFCLFIFLSFLSCDSNSDSGDLCTPVIFDAAKFNSSENPGINLNDFSVDGDCLYVTLGVSGCDENHTIEMVSDGAIAESLPPQITFDFYDQNPQSCAAFFLLKREYDLRPINDVYEGEILVKFRNNNSFFTYSQ